MIIEKIIQWSVRQRWLVLFITLCASGWGFWSFLSLPIDAVPDITNIQVQVNVTSKGLAPDDLEKKVTYPIEIAMGGIPDVHEIRSLTKFGLSQVTVIFDDSSDIYRDRQLVTEKLQTLTEFPPGVDKPTLSPISTGLGEIYHYTVKYQGSSDPVWNLMQAREIQEWVIRPRLLSIPGIVEVNAIGGYQRQVQVQPKIDALTKYRITLSDLKAALQQTNQNAGGSYIQENNRQLLVQASGQFQSLEDIKNVPVKTLQNFHTLKVKDLADVQFAGAIRVGASLVNGEEAVLGTVMMLSGANSRTVAKAVDERIREIQRGKELPEGTQIIPLYDRSILVDATLNTVIHNLLVGAFLVILVLFLLLGNMKAALVVSISIPVTLLITFAFMKIFNISGNLMSLGALDFGIIVDGAVIVVDHCIRWIQDPKRSMPIFDKVTKASQEIRSAAGFGQIMIIVVFLPILGLGGIEGKMFRPMAETFSIALAIALILSFTLIPALSAILLTDKESDKEPLLMRKVSHLYVTFLRTMLNHPRIVVGSASALGILCIPLFLNIGAEFLPRLDEGSLILQMLRPIDISLNSSIQKQAQSEKLLKQLGPVATVFSRIGTPEIATDPMGQHESDTFITLKEPDQWQIDGTYYSSKPDMVRALVQKIEGSIPDQEISSTQPIQMRFNDLLEGTRADLTIKVYGDDLKTLSQITRQISEIVKKVPGSGDVLQEFRGPTPLLQIVPDYARLSRYSLSAAPILDAISIGMAGEEVGFYYEGLRRLPLLVKLSEEVRQDLNAIKKLQVFAGPNLTVPLDQLTTFESKNVLSPILREGSQRRSAVLINPKDRDIQNFVNTAQAKLNHDLKIPNGYRIEWFGSFKNLQDAKQRLIILGPLALFLVAAMLYWAFGNLKETFIVLATVPLALIGGIIGLTLTSIPFSISAAIGFIALVGISVLNGVVLMNYFNELRSQPAFSNKKWILHGAELRLRPVLMTALVDIFGFIPMSISTGVGAEIQKPLATVIIGGVITSTLLTLIVLPSVCSIALSDKLLEEDSPKAG